MHTVLIALNLAIQENKLGWLKSEIADLEIRVIQVPSDNLNDSLLSCYFVVIADKPTIQELTILRKGDGSKLEVIKWITAHEEWKCEDFANLLLRDDVQVKAYLSDRMGKNNFVRTVLKDWLARDDDDELAVPRTWEALTKSISDAGLAGTLAKAIRDACQPSGDFDT